MKTVSVPFRKATGMPYVLALLFGLLLASLLWIIGAALAPPALLAGQTWTPVAGIVWAVVALAVGIYAAGRFSYRTVAMVSRDSVAIVAGSLFHRRRATVPMTEYRGVIVRTEEQLRRNGSSWMGYVAVMDHPHPAVCVDLFVSDKREVARARAGEYARALSIEWLGFAGSGNEHQR